MRHVKQHIDSWESIFKRHPFFKRFDDTVPVASVLAFAPHMTFWVMAFQDILRLNQTLIFDPALRAIAQGHGRDDGGHERWFLADLEALNTVPTSIEFLFHRRSAAVRAATYALVAEVYRASDDAIRIAFVLALEAAGRVFFENTSRYSELAALGSKLLYFSHNHLTAEEEHDLFEDEATTLLDKLELTKAVREEALAMVDRTYHAFIAMFDTLEEIDFPPSPRSLRRMSTIPARDRAEDDSPSEPAVAHTGGK